MTTYGGVDESVFEKRIRAVQPLVEGYLQPDQKNYSENLRQMIGIYEQVGRDSPENSGLPQKMRQLVDEFKQLSKSKLAPPPKTTLEQLRTLPNDQKIAVFHYLAAVVFNDGFHNYPSQGYIKAGQLVKLLIAEDLPYQPYDLAYLAQTLQRTNTHFQKSIFPLVPFFQKLHELGRLTEETKSILKQHLPRLMRSFADWRRDAMLLLHSLHDQAHLPLEPGEAWSRQAIMDFDQMSQPSKQAWVELFLHCQSASGSKPSRTWLKQARTLMDAVTPADFQACTRRWLPLVDQPRVTFLPEMAHYKYHADAIIPLHTDILKGLVWSASMLESDAIARVVSELAVSAFRKIPGSGPRLMALGNACIWSLGAMPTQAAVGRLAWLKVKLKITSAQKTIDKALTSAADRLGLPRDEIEEMAVPAYGLEEVGLRSETLGDHTAQLRITATHHTELLFIKPDGKTVKAPPKAITESFAQELKDLKTAARDIQKMIPAQRDRLDSLYLQNKSWLWPVWRQRYLDHPLVGTLARRLIWQFTRDGKSSAAIWLKGALVTADDQPLDTPTDDTRVTLWHPIHQPMDDILTWRDWLMRHQVQQPFKQAHREVYLLTDAERRTEVYSNRFAAHILKQHQFNALCAARSWRNRLRLLVDDIHPPASRLLPAWNLRAEYWIEGIGNNFGIDTLESGAFLYLSTDQVRFYPINTPENSAHAFGGGYQTTDTPPLPLRDIPPLVFSECMRDVDLFVGVSSVGNDPAWQDTSSNQNQRDYWQQYSFGPLTTSATTRKELLQTLIPRLKIASRCSFDEKYLIVQGQLRTYKIHLGSGNILMAPNDQYLCIVPKPASLTGAENKVFLPFEGDRTLSVILSKAFMLAADDKITDPTIVSQINRQS